MPAKPLSPDAALLRKAEMLPDFVIEAANHLLARNLVDGESEFTQSAFVQEILTRAAPETTPQHCVDNRWLDIEAVFTKAGWNVTYDRPGYNESYTPVYRFTRKRS